MSDTIELQKIVGEVAAAYFSNSHVSPVEIPTVINQIANSLAAVGAPAVDAEPAAPDLPKLTSAQIRKSITPDALISFEDNKGYKTLRRHLAAHGLTPEQYRTKWGLPQDYPMVAPSYSEARSKLAKAAGLGNRAVAQPAAGPDRAVAAGAAKRAANKRQAPVRSRKTKAAATTSAAAE